MMHTLTGVLTDNPFNSNPGAIPGVTQFQTIIGYTAWGATALCLIGLLTTGGMMAISYHQGSNDHMGRIGGVAAGCMIVGTAGTLAGSLLGFNLFTSDPQAIPGLSMVQTIIGYIAWIMAGVCVIGLIIAGALLATSYRRGSSEHAGRIGSVAAGCVIVGGASTIIGALI
jgi:hypothetical protein